MKIEWWMIDGIIGLILLISIIRGIARGIGDTVLRLVGLGGGFLLGIKYMHKVAEYLALSPMQRTIQKNIYKLLRTAGFGVDETVMPGDGTVIETLGTRPDPYSGIVPKTLGGVASDLSDRTAEAAALKLTDLAIGIISFVLILLAVWFVMCIIRAIYRALRKDSLILSFADRVMGLTLGAARGMIVVCVFVAVLMPLAAFFIPDRVPEVLDALHHTKVAGVIYDINPFMLLIDHLIP